MVDTEFLWKFLGDLENADIHFTMHRHRGDVGLSVHCRVPGEVWEVDFLNDGTIAVEVLRSDPEMYDHTKLKNLFE